jgi:beta-glucosidase
MDITITRLRVRRRESHPKSIFFLQVKLFSERWTSIMASIKNTPSVAVSPYQNPALPIEQRVADLLARMTVEEKIVQLQRIIWEELDFLGEDVNFLDAEGWLAVAKAIEQFKNGVCGFGRISLKRTPRQSAELTNAIQAFLRQHTRLGIPALFNEEALHGLMA